MNLVSGDPFWPIKDGAMTTYPSLQDNLKCDVAIIGGGISGALIAYELTKKGVDCILVEKRTIGDGSTSASTALLEYELDISLHELIDLIGEKNAVTVYKLTQQSLKKIDAISKEVGEHGAFEHKKSLYFASGKKDAKKIEKEFTIRRKYGFKVELLSRRDLKKYNVDAENALMSYESAQIDPYRFTHKVIEKCVKMGLRVFNKTNIVGYEARSRSVVLKTSSGFQITAKKVVFATGYESQEYLSRSVVKFTTDYALVSKPLSKKEMGCLNLYTAWNSATDYLYASTIGDRIMVGLSGIEFDTAKQREKKLRSKAKEIIRKFSKYFPKIKFEIDHVWAGTFGLSKDSMPFIGEVKKFPNAYFALGYGGNGIAFSVIAAEIIRDKYLGKTSPEADLFRFDR